MTTPPAYEGPSQASSPGYGAQPPAAYPQATYAQGHPGYGYPVAPRPPKRPGNATAAGVVGIVFGVLLFPYAAALLIAASTLSDRRDPSLPGNAETVFWISGILAVLAAVVTFVGSIQMLSGSNAVIERIGGVLGIAAIWVLAIWGLTQIPGDNGSTVIVTGACVASVFPALVLGLSMSPSIGKWFAKKRAYRAAGLSED